MNREEFQNWLKSPQGQAALQAHSNNIISEYNGRPGIDPSSNTYGIFIRRG